MIDEKDYAKPDDVFNRCLKGTNLTPPGGSGMNAYDALKQAREKINELVLLTGEDVKEAADKQEILALLAQVQAEQGCPICRGMGHHPHCSDHSLLACPDCGGSGLEVDRLKKRIENLQAELSAMRGHEHISIAEKDEQITELRAALANANIVIKNNSEYEIKERGKLEKQLADLQAEIERLANFIKCEIDLAESFIPIADRAQKINEQNFILRAKAALAAVEAAKEKSAGQPEKARRKMYEVR